MFTRITAVREINNVETKQELLVGTGYLTNNVPEPTPVGNNGAKVTRGSKDHRLAIRFPDHTLGKDEQGRTQSRFFAIEAWGKTAEQLSKVGFKNREIEIVARIQKNTWTPEGATEAREVEILVIERFDAKPMRNSSGTANNNSSAGTSAQNESGNAESGASTGNASSQDENKDPFKDDGRPIDISEDDIPF